MVRIFLLCERQRPLDFSTHYFLNIPVIPLTSFLYFQVAHNSYIKSNNSTLTNILFVSLHLGRAMWAHDLKNHMQLPATK